jgi:hypothetical protein
MSNTLQHKKDMISALNIHIDGVNHNIQQLQQEINSLNAQLINAHFILNNEKEYKRNLLYSLYKEQYGTEFPIELVNLANIHRLPVSCVNLIFLIKCPNDDSQPSDIPTSQIKKYQIQMIEHRKCYCYQCLSLWHLTDQCPNSIRDDSSPSLPLLIESNLQSQLTNQRVSLLKK